MTYIFVIKDLWTGRLSDSITALLKSAVLATSTSQVRNLHVAPKVIFILIPVSEYNYCYWLGFIGYTKMVYLESAVVVETY